MGNSHCSVLVFFSDLGDLYCIAEWGQLSGWGVYVCGGRGGRQAEPCCEMCDNGALLSCVLQCLSVCVWVCVCVCVRVCVKRGMMWVDAV